MKAFSVFMMKLQCTPVDEKNVATSKYAGSGGNWVLALNTSFWWQSFEHTAHLFTHFCPSQTEDNSNFTFACFMIAGLVKILREANGDWTRVSQGIKTIWQWPQKLMFSHKQTRGCRCGNKNIEKLDALSKSIPVPLITLRPMAQGDSFSFPTKTSANWRFHDSFNAVRIWRKP